MESTAHSSAATQPEAAFGAAMRRFAELLELYQQELGRTRDPQAAMRALGIRLGAEVERWVRESAPTLGVRGFGPALNPLASLMPQAMTNAARTAELLTKWVELQGQLGVLWGDVARSAAARFTQSVTGLAPGSPADDVRRHYDLWIDCAEEAYSATVRTPHYCRVQSELINISAALIAQRHCYTDTLAHLAGLATRGELQAVQQELRELRSQLEARAAPPALRRRKRRR
jgi:Poly(R)-hydroxyalkanoic acid synthase subunit (PHA_synth_III_E)